MGTVLLTWEMGRGLGHLVPLSPIATGLARRGHHVYLAARDLSRVHIALDRNLVTCIQAPLYLRPGGEAIAPAMTFAHILYNNGFGAADQLQALADAWITLYRWVKPDLIIFDHSPTALLASRASRASKALVGLGFFCPPDADPLPNLRTWLNPDPRCLRQGEQRVLENMNQVLHALGQPPLDRITQMYAQVDENFLATFPELDHYPDRSGEMTTWLRVKGPAGQSNWLVILMPNLQGRPVPKVQGLSPTSARITLNHESETMHLGTDAQHQAAVERAGRHTVLLKANQVRLWSELDFKSIPADIDRGGL